MPPSPTYLLVSLPASITPSRHKDEALAALQAAIPSDTGNVQSFAIPTFKIGTLDALVQQADDLAKLNTACEGVVNKVGDALQGIVAGDEEKAAQQKTINDKPVDQYLRSFLWNKSKFRTDKSIADLIDSLQKEVAGIDKDVKEKFGLYNQIKTQLAASQRKQTGNLSTRSLASIVPPEVLIQDSDYLETHLIAVPNPQTKSFLKSYETLAPMTVPRSASQIADDSEFTLFAVTTFKKHSADFVHKCREARWTPRDYKHKEGGREEEAKEVDRLSQEERKLWGEALRQGRTGYSESAMIWIHVLALRVFVETVLRYGLPLDFICGLVQTNSKLAKKARISLDASFSYLGGNAIGRDKKGRIKHDDADMQGLGDGSEYSPYVYYEFEIL